MVAKGDANNSTDKPITGEQILGKVISIIPKVGLIKKALLSPEVIKISIIFIIFIVVSKIIFTKIKKGEGNSTKNE